MKKIIIIVGVFLVIAAAVLWFTQKPTQHSGLSPQEAYEKAVSLFDKSPKKAMPYILKAIKGNIPEAVLLLGDILLINTKTKEDYKKVFSLYSKAKDEGLDIANDRMVEILREMTISEKDIQFPIQRFDFSKREVLTKDLDIFIKQGEVRIIDSMLAAALIYWMQEDFEQTDRWLYKAGFSSHYQAQVMRVLFLLEQPTYGDAREAYVRLRESLTLVQIKNLFETSHWLEWFPGAEKKLNKLEKVS